MDGGIYAGKQGISGLMLQYINFKKVKKIRLKPNQADNKIFREVNALSRLSHRFIVRYYTTWLEESEPTSSTASSTSSQGSSDVDDQTAGVASTEMPSRTNGSATPDSEIFRDPMTIDLNELMNSDDTQTSSFPSIHFTSGDVAEDSSEEEDADSLQLVERRDRVYAVPMTVRTLYIQMVRNSLQMTTSLLKIRQEYVERQTLKEVCVHPTLPREWLLIFYICACVACLRKNL